ncbi:MAG: hypothetical protein WB729_15810 [Candidatus Sulfotelmatobacter sp.]
MLVPAATPVASPVGLTVATLEAEDAQAAVVLTFAVDPSLYVAVALNCWVSPEKMLAVVGDTAIAVTVGAIGDTVSAALPLIPENVAVTVVAPAAIPLARPVEFTVATDWLASDHVAVELTFAVEPSLYFAVATNCSVAPAAIVAVPGVTETAVIVFA